MNCLLCNEIDPHRISCSASAAHSFCQAEGCFLQFAKSVPAGGFRGKGGNIPCSMPGCAGTYTLDKVVRACGGNEAFLIEFIEKLATHEVDSSLTQRLTECFEIVCPQVMCQKILDPNPEGCTAMCCVHCQTYFCWVCFQIFDDDPDCHAHVRHRHGGNYFVPEAVVAASHRVYKRERFVRIMSGLSPAARSRILQNEEALLNGIDPELVILARNIGDPQAPLAPPEALAVFGNPQVVFDSKNIAAVTARGAAVAANHTALSAVTHLIPYAEAPSRALSYVFTGSATTLRAPSMVISLAAHVACDGYDLATKPNIDKRKVVLQYVGWTVAGGLALAAATPFVSGIGVLGTIVAVAGEGGYYAVKAFG